MDKQVLNKVEQFTKENNSTTSIFSDQYKKYIVYLTTNTENGNIYVGVHLTRTPKFDGYLGCGVYANVPYTYKRSKTVFQLAVNKYGPKSFRRVTLKSFDNEDDAYRLEAFIVDKEFLKRKDVYNTSLGGKNGNTPYLMKRVYKYDMEGNYIDEYESIADAADCNNLARCSVSHAVDNFPMGGFLWSAIKYDKLNLETFRIDENKVPVYQYDSKTGNFITEYKSLSEACRNLDYSTSNLTRAIKLGYLVHNKYYFSYTKLDHYSKAKTEDLKQNKIHQYNISGEYLQSFNDVKEASIHTGLKVNDILTAIKLDRQIGGYQFSFTLEPNKKDLSDRLKFTTGLKVGQYTLDGELVRTYNTVSECKKDFPGCCRVLKGKGKTCKGYIFKYIS